MKTPALFLDFDGVLVESVEIKSQAFRALFDDQPLEILEKIMAHHLANTGISRVVKIQYCYTHFLQTKLSDSELVTLTQRYATLVEHAVVTAPWVKGAKRFVECHHRQMPLFVVSGTPEVEMLRIVKARGMNHWFTAVRGSPARKAEIVRDLAHAHAIDTDRSTFIGDAMADFDAARDTGLHFIGRVAPGDDNPFPDDIEIVQDLSKLVARNFN